jgi:AcrR family transcriptional regulator
MGRRTAVRPRKEPRQERSRHMNETILEGAARVLVREGPAAFTTNRVAEVAGVSVGSLYQYYPNKEAVLFRLHEREVQATWATLGGILSDASRTPRQRFEAAVRAFFEAEAEELPLRTALQRAELYFDDTPEYREVESQAVGGVREFLREALPPETRELDFKARLVQTVVSSVAERLTNRGVKRSELRKWARVCSGMLCDYLGI